MTLPTRTIDRLKEAIKDQQRRSDKSKATSELVARGLVKEEDASILRNIEPTVEAMFLMMCADARVQRSELDLIWDTVRSLSGQDLPGEAIKAMVTIFKTQLNEQGWPQSLQRVAEKLVDNRAEAEAAFSLVATVAMVDEKVTTEENTLLDQLAKGLEISDKRYCELVDDVRVQGS